MATRPLSLGVQSNPGRHPAAGAARLINAYCEDAGQEGVMRWPIYAADGLADFGSTGASGGIRAMLQLNGQLYGVGGRSVFRSDLTGTTTIIGGMASDGLVTMARNGKVTPQIALTCDGLSQIIENGILTQITDPDLPPANSVTAVGDYFAWGSTDGQITISELSEGFEIDSADFVTAEAKPDSLVRLCSLGLMLVAFGTESTEFWPLAGGEFPFSRSAVRDYGLLAAGSVATVDETLAFVARDHTVRIIAGYDGKVISTDAVARAVKDETDKANISGTSWRRAGHTFYAISGTDWTWVYDFATGLWHERRSYGLDRWLVSQTADFGDVIIAGHYSEGSLYTLSPDHTDEAGDPLLWTVQLPTITAFPKRVEIGRIDFFVLPGVGTLEETDPQLMMSRSENGRDFGHERMASIGAMGQDQTGVHFGRLGTTGRFGRTYRFTMSADVVKGAVGAAIDAKTVG